MISLQTQSAPAHAPSFLLDNAVVHRSSVRPVAANLALQRWECEGGAITEQPPESAVPHGVPSVAPSPEVVPARHDSCEPLPRSPKSSSLGRAALTVAVTITVKAVAALIIATIVFDGTQILLAAAAGTLVMTLVGLPSLLAAISDIHEDTFIRMGPPTPIDGLTPRKEPASIPSTRPADELLVPGQRVRVIRQMPQRDQCWTPAVEGTVVSCRQEATGSWFAHAKNHKLWLDRLMIQHDDGEFTDCILDSYTRVEILDDAARTPVATVSGNGYASSPHARPQQRRRVLSRPRRAARSAPRFEGFASLSQQEGA